MREKLVATQTPATGGFSVTVSRVGEELSPQRWEAVDRVRRPDLELALAQSVDPEGTKALTVDTVASHRYAIAPGELWDKLEEVTLERGFMMEGFDPPIDAVATSIWVEDEDRGQRSRFEVRFARHGEQLGVEIGERREKAVGQRVWTASRDERDLNLELGLVRHRDPSHAGKVEVHAEQAGQQAYDDAIARGAPRGCSCTY